MLYNDKVVGGISRTAIKQFIFDCFALKVGKRSMGEQSQN